MSWLTGLAGKAEELLNKVDQSAAESLNTSLVSQGSRPSTPKPTHLDDQTSGLHATPTSRSATPVQQRLSQTSGLSSGTLSSQLPESKSVARKPGSKKTLDDELFDFLNSESPKDIKKKSVHSRQSSTGSAKTGDSGLYFTARPQTPADEPEVTTATTATISANSDENPSPVDRNSGSSTCPSDYEVVENPASEMMTSMTSTHSGNGEGNLKSLELENSLLKNEVQSLNSEMTSLLKRTKQAESELAESKQQIDVQSNKVSQLEQVLREMRDREVDQAEALKAKDSQVAVLRVRLEELEQEVTTKTSHLNELEQDRERILQDHTDSSGLHNQALDNLKKKLDEKEQQLKLEQEQLQRSDREHIERNTKLETEQRSLSESIVQLQKKVSEEKNRNESLSQQLKNSKASCETFKQELKDYKEKATRILQSKDKLISSMRDGVGASDGSSEISAGITAEIEQERNLLRQELQESSSTIESLRMEIQDLETQLQADHDEAREMIENLEDKLRREETKTKDVEQELRGKADELQYMQDQSVSQKTALQQQIYERDQEIEKLRNQLMSKKLNASTETELETRLHSLTENLIQKQTLVESLSTERNSLKLQLERAEKMCKELERSAQASSSASTAVYIGEEDGVRQRGHLPGFMKESPTDPEFTRRVKRAANTIDKFSIRLGVFLRRYPIARVFVIVYMLLLHLWTMIVLLTYQPEMHGAEHSHLPVPN